MFHPQVPARHCYDLSPKDDLGQILQDNQDVSHGALPAILPIPGGMQISGPRQPGPDLMVDATEDYVVVPAQRIVAPRSPRVRVYHPHQHILREHGKTQPNANAPLFAVRPSKGTSDTSSTTPSPATGVPPVWSSSGFEVTDPYSHFSESTWTTTPGRRAMSRLPLGFNGLSILIWVKEIRKSSIPS